MVMCSSSFIMVSYSMAGIYHDVFIHVTFYGQLSCLWFLITVKKMA